MSLKNEDLDSCKRDCGKSSADNSDYERGRADGGAFWETEAARYASNTEWLKGILLKCAALLGAAVYKDDLGVEKPDPFVSKVPGAIESMISNNSMLKEALVEAVARVFVLEARLAGNSPEMSDAMGREVRNSLLNIPPNYTDKKDI